MRSQILLQSINPGFTDPIFQQLILREWKVLILLADDFTNIDIVKALGLKQRTVCCLLDSIGSKLSLNNLHSVTVFARNHRNLILHQYSIYRLQAGNQQNKSRPTLC